MDAFQLIIYQNEYVEKAYYYRGKMIDTFNSLEKAIERYFMKHFEVKDDDSFQAIILDRLTFQSKKDALSAILNEKSKNAGFLKTKNNAWPNSKIIKAISEAQEIRNYFAHYNLFVPKSETECIICLAEFRDSLTLKQYTLDQYNEILTKIDDARESVYALY